MGLFASNHYTPQRFSNPLLPAVTAAGLDYIWEAPSKANIPSNGKQIRVSLRSDVVPVKAFYEATPSIQEMAYLKATVQNPSSQAILKGNANIFISNRFGSQGVLETTGPGGMLELPLGADEDVRLVRSIIPQQRTEGMFNKEDITDYRVRIEVGNHKKQPLNIRIRDQIPVSKHEKISIKMGGVNPPSTVQPDVQGIFYWDLTIPSNETTVLEFQYSITRPKDWVLRGY